MNQKQFTYSILALIFLLISFGCQSKSDRDYFDSAKNNINESKYVEALNDFESLVKEFPNSSLAEQTYFEIGKLYHGQVVKNLSKEESLQKAIENYKVVYTKFPESKSAAHSFFMVGFIQANELNQFDSAEVTYRAFLEKYPDNEMAISAQAELDNLGLSPEEILKRKIAESSSAK
ncbi:MAG: tetratricopeptide repeat protein [Bacteroidetes bacterium]|nr:tetratricopeptide repeat protein [Bacteroidota bacterium]MBU1679243.1 tetratricopeptide repeat protein [Bacteroidota bacterium]MBU2506857.1 tetratricopeptide repeat protein [Bacteroidota bacterium]